MNHRLPPGTDLNKSKCKISNSISNEKVVTTSHPLVFCSKLPQHWRSNKSLPSLFQVILCQNKSSLLAQTDGYRVWLSASNQSLSNAILRNYESKLINGQAKFNDLRFISRSGRGKYFDVYIHVDCNPKIVAVYSNAIKVTVDGPREPRNKHRNLIVTKAPLSIPHFIPSQKSDSELPFNESSEEVEERSKWWRLSQLETNIFTDVNGYRNRMLPFSTTGFRCHGFQPSPIGHNRNKPENLSFFHLMMMMMMSSTAPISASILPMIGSHSELYNSSENSVCSPNDDKDLNKPKIWRPF